jgi:branched-chain amino acid transport system permease protein
MFLMGYSVNDSRFKPVLMPIRTFGEPVSVLLLTAAFAIVLENLCLMLFGADYVMAQTSFSSQPLALGSVNVSAARFFGLLIALVVAFMFYMFLQYSQTGRNLRATGQDRNAAALMGIDVTKTYAIAFGIGTALLAVAAVALIPFYYVHPSVGAVFMTKAFIVVVLGGWVVCPRHFRRHYYRFD